MTPDLASPLQVIVLCGLPFAGKSTLARALAERLDLVHVEVDQAVRETAEYVPGAPIPRSAWITAYRVSYRRMEAALAAGRSVVLDATNYRRLHRDLIRAKAARLGAETTVVSIAIAAAEIDARRERNRRSPTRPDVGQDDFAMVQRDMQAPGPDEHPILYAPGMSIDSLVVRLIGAGASLRTVAGKGA